MPRRRGGSPPDEYHGDARPHAGRPAPGRWPTARSRRWKPLTAPGPSDPGLLKVVHGDLHYENVLHALPGQPPRWVAIDPLPVAGYPEWEVAPVIRNRWDDAAATGDPSAHSAAGSTSSASAQPSTATWRRPCCRRSRSTTSSGSPERLTWARWCGPSSTRTRSSPDGERRDRDAPPKSRAAPGRPVGGARPQGHPVRRRRRYRARHIRVRVPPRRGDRGPDRGHRPARRRHALRRAGRLGRDRGRRGDALGDRLRSVRADAVAGVRDRLAAGPHENPLGKAFGRFGTIATALGYLALAIARCASPPSGAPPARDAPRPRVSCRASRSWPCGSAWSSRVSSWWCSPSGRATGACGDASSTTCEMAPRAWSSRSGRPGWSARG